MQRIPLGIVHGRSTDLHWEKAVATTERNHCGLLGSACNGAHYQWVIFKRDLLVKGDGVPPSEAREFCDWLGSSAAPMLPNPSFSVCALGDT